MLTSLEFAKEAIRAEKQADNSITIGGEKLQYDDKVGGWIYNKPIIIKALLKVNAPCSTCKGITEQVVNANRTKIKCMKCQTVKEIQYE
jgi:formamidopyrimidine-DNA glycosylase